MALTLTDIKKAEPREKAYKLTAGKSLYLLIQPNGGKYWRMDYTSPATKKRKTLAIGIWPAISKVEAEDYRDEAKRKIRSGIDPMFERKAVKRARVQNAENSFEAVGREWYEKQVKGWAPSHASKIISRLERDIFPWIGDQPIADVTAPMLLSALLRVESRGAIETAHRELQVSGQIFRYAIATGRAQYDVSVALRRALTPWRVKHYPAVTEPCNLGPLLRAIDGFTGTFPVRCALQLAPLLFLRPGNLRKGEWAEIDLDAALWTIPKDKMKIKTLDLLVPLPSQAVSILRELRPLTGHSRWVFPGVRDHQKPMSDAAINAAFRRMGFVQETLTGHGFRATATTILDEILHFPKDLIEQQMGHKVSDPLGRAYNRTKHFPERSKMMQRWADYLDDLKASVGIALPTDVP